MMRGDQVAVNVIRTAFTIVGWVCWFWLVGKLVINWVYYDIVYPLQSPCQHKYDMIPKFVLLSYSQAMIIKESIYEQYLSLLFIYLLTIN